MHNKTCHLRHENIINYFDILMTMSNVFLLINIRVIH